MLLPSLVLTRLTDPLLPLPYPSAAALEILHHRCSGDLGFAAGFFFFTFFFLPIASLLFKEPRLTRRFHFLQRLIWRGRSSSLGISPLCTLFLAHDRRKAARESQNQWTGKIHIALWLHLFDPQGFFFFPPPSIAHLYIKPTAPF